MQGCRSTRGSITPDPNPPPAARRDFHAPTITPPRANRQQPRPQVHSARPQCRQPQPPTGPAEDKPPHLDHPQPIPRQRPRSTRPEAIFLHPSPAATGTPRRHQPHKIARSAPSAILRQIHRAISAPVTAPFLRFCVNPPRYPQTPFRPFYRPPNIALRCPRRSYPGPRYSEAQ